MPAIWPFVVLLFLFSWTSSQYSQQFVRRGYIKWATNLKIALHLLLVHGRNVAWHWRATVQKSGSLGHRNRDFRFTYLNVHVEADWSCKVTLITKSTRDTLGIFVLPGMAFVGAEFLIKTNARVEWVGSPHVHFCSPPGQSVLLHIQPVRVSKIVTALRICARWLNVSVVVMIFQNRTTIALQYHWRLWLVLKFTLQTVQNGSFLTITPQHWVFC
jgi:hypothetical protein